MPRVTPILPRTVSALPRSAPQAADQRNDAPTSAAHCGPDQELPGHSHLLCKECPLFAMGRTPANLSPLPCCFHVPMNRWAEDRFDYGTSVAAPPLLGLPPLFLPAQLLQTSSIDRGEAGVKHADRAAAQRDGMPPDRPWPRRHYWGFRRKTTYADLRPSGNSEKMKPDAPKPRFRTQPFCRPRDFENVIGLLLRSIIPWHNFPADRSWPLRLRLLRPEIPCSISRERSRY